MANRKSKSWGIWFLGILLALPLLCVLSFGPAAWLANAGHVSDETILRGFGPILRMAANSRHGSIESIILWYAGLTAPDREKTRLSTLSFTIDPDDANIAKADDVRLRWDGGPSLDSRW